MAAQDEYNTLKQGPVKEIPTAREKVITDYVKQNDGKEM